MLPSFFKVVIFGLVATSGVPTTSLSWQKPRLEISEAGWDSQRITCTLAIPSSGRNETRLANPPRFMYLNHTYRGSVVTFATDRYTEAECYASRVITRDLPELTTTSCVYDADLSRMRGIGLYLRPFSLYDAYSWKCGAIIDDDPNDDKPPIRIETRNNELYDINPLRRYFPISSPFPRPSATVSIDWQPKESQVTFRCVVPNFDAKSAFETRVNSSKIFDYPTAVDFELAGKRIRGDFFGRYLEPRRIASAVESKTLDAGTRLVLRDVNCSSTLPNVECFLTGSGRSRAIPTARPEICGRFTRLSDIATYINSSPPSIRPHMATILSMNDHRARGWANVIEDTLIVHTPPTIVDDYWFEPIGPKKRIRAWIFEYMPQRSIPPSSNKGYLPRVVPSAYFARMMSEMLLELFAKYRNVRMGRWKMNRGKMEMRKPCRSGEALFVTRPTCLTQVTTTTHRKWFGDPRSYTNWCDTFGYRPIVKPYAEILALPRALQCALPIYYCFTERRKTPPKIILRPPIYSPLPTIASVGYEPLLDSSCVDERRIEPSRVAAAIDYAIRAAANKYFYVTKASTMIVRNESQCPCETSAFICPKSSAPADDKNVAAAARVLLTDALAVIRQSSNPINFSCGAFGRRSPTSDLQTLLTSTVCRDPSLIDQLRNGTTRNLTEVVDLLPKPLLTFRRTPGVRNDSSITGVRFAVRCALKDDVEFSCREMASDAMYARIFLKNPRRLQGTVTNRRVDRRTSVAEFAIDPTWERDLMEISCAYALPTGSGFDAYVRSAEKIVWNDISALYTNTCLPTDYVATFSRAGLNSSRVACRVSHFSPGCTQPTAITMIVDGRRTIGSCRADGSDDVCQTRVATTQSLVYGEFDNADENATTLTCVATTTEFSVNFTKNITEIAATCVPPPTEFVPAIVAFIDDRMRVNVFCSYPHSFVVDLCSPKDGAPPPAAAIIVDRTFGYSFTTSDVLVHSEGTDDPCRTIDDQNVESCKSNPLPEQTYTSAVLSTHFLNDTVARTLHSNADRLDIAIRCRGGWNTHSSSVPLGLIAEKVLGNWKNGYTATSTKVTVVIKIKTEMTAIARRRVSTNVWSLFPAISNTLFTLL